MKSINKSILAFALLASVFSIQNVSAQIAIQKGITLEEVSKHINSLAQKNDIESKTQLSMEAKALVASKNEQFVSLGARLYDFIGDSEAAEVANNSILKKFPKGIKARQNELDKIFNGDNKEGALSIEKQYSTWLKKYPSSSFDPKNQNIYDQANANMAVQFFKEDNIERGNYYIEKFQSNPSFPIYVSPIVNTLIKNQQYETALPIIEQAYEQSYLDFTSADPTKNRGNIAGRYNSLTPLYAKVLLSLGQNKKSAEVLETYFSNNNYGKSSAENNLLLANNYVALGRELDAFSVLNDFLIEQSFHDEIVEQIQPLYLKLNSQNGDFDRYITNTKTKAKDALEAKYKSEMIKKEAPQFSLLDMDGKTVSLADMKGKVVVLDFWATWCGPCKISFPGMQAAVNKYKDDPEVAFLFIDTWQREENYKELVENFITANKYTFHVLYDEMKDRSKATTTAFDVKGIPHKVVIDKEGNIRFESSGGTADINKIVDEISTKIELARKG